MNDSYNRAVELIANPPNFRKCVYENPKTVYNNLIIFIDCINGTLNDLNCAQIETCVKIIDTDPSEFAPSWALNVNSNSSLITINNTLREFRRTAANLDRLLTEANRVKTKFFENVFSMYFEDETRVPHYSTKYGRVRKYQTIDTLIDDRGIDRDGYDSIASIPCDSEVSPLMTNFMRFHGMEKDIRGFRVIPRGSSSEIVVELDDFECLYTEVYPAIKKGC